MQILRVDLKAWALALATALGAWGGFPAPPKAFSDFIAKNPWLPWVLVGVLVWQGGGVQEWHTAVIAALILWAVGKLIQKFVDDRKAKERRMQ